MSIFMNLRFLFLLAGLIIFTNIHSNCQVINGQIIDRVSRKGIDMVTVTVSPTSGTLTDSLGYFSIEVPKYPVELSISHLSYGAQSFTLNYHPKQKLVFQLEEIRTYIPEILVSGKKLQILTKGADYSISHFEFDDKYMWQLGMVNNRANKGRLYLANLVGDTVHSIPAELPAILHKDYFGNVHYETKDSIFQLYGMNDSIQLLYGNKREEFHESMDGFDESLGSGLIFFLHMPNQRGKQMYYIDSSIREPEQIKVKEKLIYDFSWLPPHLQQLGRYLGDRTVQQILDQQLDYFKANNPDTIFTLKDSLYLVDLSNDKIHTIGPDRKMVRSVPISFHHQANPTVTNLYLNYDEFVIDNLNQKAYIQYHTNNNWRFVPFDHLTGRTGQEIPTPKFNAMANIRIHGGAIYFTYPEKVFPYFQRIYRQIIK